MAPGPVGTFLATVDEPLQLGLGPSLGSGGGGGGGDGPLLRERAVMLKRPAGDGASSSRAQAGGGRSMAEDVHEAGGREGGRAQGRETREMVGGEGGSDQLGAAVPKPGWAQEVDHLDRLGPSLGPLMRRLGNSRPPSCEQAIGRPCLDHLQQQQQLQRQLQHPQFQQQQQEQQQQEQPLLRQLQPQLLPPQQQEQQQQMSGDGGVVDLRGRLGTSDSPGTCPLSSFFKGEQQAGKVTLVSQPWTGCL